MRNFFGKFVVAVLLVMTCSTNEAAPTNTKYYLATYYSDVNFGALTGLYVSSSNIYQVSQQAVELMYGVPTVTDPPTIFSGKRTEPPTTPVDPAEGMSRISFSYKSAVAFYPGHSNTMMVSDRLDHRVWGVLSFGDLAKFAGNGADGGGSFAGNGFDATSAALGEPAGLNMDASGNTYLSDGTMPGIRRIDFFGKIFTFVPGSASDSGDGGQATAAGMLAAKSVFRSGNNLYFSTQGCKVRMVNLLTGIINTVAGSTCGGSGVDVAATSAEIQKPQITGDTNGNLFFYDETYTVRRVNGNNQMIYTIAGALGNGINYGVPVAGDATAAQLNDVKEWSGIGMDSAGNLYFSTPFDKTIFTLSDKTSSPTESPSVVPSVAPSTTTPSAMPSVVPSAVPSMIPSVVPSVIPSVTPSIEPSAVPSVVPSVVPSATPSIQPSVVPSVAPTVVPSEVPTVTSASPSVTPSVSPSAEPSVVPSVVPSETPSEAPSATPSVLPSVEPSQEPSVVPSAVPSVKPSRNPSRKPSVRPSRVPTGQPSFKPSVAPTVTFSGVEIATNLTVETVHREQGSGRRLAEAGSMLLLEASDKAIIAAVVEILDLSEDAVSIENEVSLLEVDGVSTVLVELKILTSADGFSSYESCFVHYKGVIDTAIKSDALLEGIVTIAEDTGAYELYQITAVNVTSVANVAAINTEVSGKDGGDLATGYFAGVVIGVIVAFLLLAAAAYVACFSGAGGGGTRQQQGVASSGALESKV